MAKNLVLYSYWRSSCSWRVRAVLEYKKIPYKYQAVNLSAGEQFSDEYKKISPSSFVPLLQFETPDGRTETISESLAIIDYLEHLVPEPSVYPKNPLDRAKVITITEMIVSGIQPLQNLEVMLKIQDWMNSKEKGLEWNRYWIMKKFELLEKHIGQTAGRYSFGNQLTLADICLVPQMFNALKYEIDIQQYPTLKRLFDFLLTVNFIEKTKPENQPDKPK